MRDSCCNSVTDVVGKTHWLDNDGVNIYVWEKYLKDPSGKPVVVLAHGSATAGRESFDLSVPGKPSYSLMDALAGMGFDVFAPDVRGFGRSTQPRGHMNTFEAVEDLNVVVDYVLKLRAVRRVHLLGWSWGTQYGGLWVSQHADKVARFISYAQMHAASPDIAKRRELVDVYRANPYLTISEEGWKTRFYAMTPEAVNDPDVVHAYVRAAVEIETQTPTGPQLDLVTHLPMVHAGMITAPTMLIHGEYDDVADTKGLSPFFNNLPNPDKKYVVVPHAGHMMHLQKGHKRFQLEVKRFFNC